MRSVTAPDRQNRRDATMAEKMSCPFCGTHVEYAIENSPDWYRDPSLPVYRIDCHDKCRQYWLEAISDPYPQIDPSILAFLNSLDGEPGLPRKSKRHLKSMGTLRRRSLRNYPLFLRASHGLSQNRVKDETFLD